MKPILLSTLALGVMASAAAAGPLTLTDGQMDAVTAGAPALVYANGTADATGRFADARTRTDARANNGGRVSLVVGLGSSRAIGSEDAETSATAIGTGDVSQRTSHDVRRQSPRLTYSHSAEWFVGISYDR